MHTVSDVIKDIQRGILAHNMIETCFSYRLVYFVNENGKGEKHYIDTRYDGLRKTLENIIRGNLSVTNTVVIATITVRKDGKSVSLLNRSYAFSLDGYFDQIVGKKEKDYVKNNYGRNMVQWC